MAWNVIDQLNKNAQAAVTDETPRARFRTKDISIKKMYSNDKNFYSMPDIEELAKQIYVFGLMENLEVAYEPCDRGEYKITAGERRWRALNLLVERGHDEFEIATCQIQTPQNQSEETLRLIVANAYRNKTAADILEEERQLKETLLQMKASGQTIKGYKLDSGRLRDVIADMLNMPATKVAQIESINHNLIPEFATELKEGRLTFSAAYEISGMDEDRQQDMLERYHESGLTYKEVKEAKVQQSEEKAAEQIDGQTTTFGVDLSPTEEPAQEPKDHEEDNEEDSTAAVQKEWEDAHPQKITSICWDCKNYADCNVKSAQCTSCDKYINKAEAEKTEEQRYSEEQDRIDRETAKKLREREDDELQEESELDKINRQIREKTDQLANYEQSLMRHYEEFCDMAVSGDIEIKDDLQLIRELIIIGLRLGFTDINFDNICSWVDGNYDEYDPDDEDEDIAIENEQKIDKARKKALNLPVTVYVLLALKESLNYITIYRAWNNALMEENATRCFRLITIIRQLGFIPDEDEFKLIKGTHPLFEEIKELERQKASLQENK